MSEEVNHCVPVLVPYKTSHPDDEYAKLVILALADKRAKEQTHIPGTNPSSGVGSLLGWMSGTADLEKDNKFECPGCSDVTLYAQILWNVYANVEDHVEAKDCLNHWRRKLPRSFE